MSGLHGESMLVRLGDLDHLLEVAGNVIINAGSLVHMYREVEAYHHTDRLLDPQLLKLVRELAEAASRNGEQLHHLVQVIRTVTVKDLVFRARRTVRETARKTGKRVRLEVAGDEVLLDKTIVEALYDPLAHQMRNAVTHGIEDPLERARLGKPEEGVIRIEVAKNETETLIQIVDDGAGVDLERLTARAVQAGLLNQGATLALDAALDLLCRPGFSTAGTVTETSGRGVGMDVVRDCLDRLGGSLSMETRPGEGTQFTYRIPLVSAVNILDALLVRADPHVYAFPITHVVASLAVPASRIRSTMEQGLVVKYLAQLLPLYDLSCIMDPTRTPSLEAEAESVNLLIVENKGRRIALRVTAFEEPQKLVIIPFGNGLHVRGLMGTTVLGGRSLGFVVDMPALIRRAEGLPEPSALRADKAGTPPAVAAAEAPVAYTPEVEEPDDAAPVGEGSGFLVEAEKNLATLNETLFHMEQAPDEETVNKAFRCFHSIKGTFAVLRLPRTADTIHAVESVLNQVRDHAMPFSAEVLDIMMDGVSFCEEALTQLRKRAWRDRAADNIIDAGKNLLPTREPGKLRDVDNETFELTREGAYRAAALLKREVPLYHCLVRFDKGDEPTFLRACLIYKRLTEVGEVLASVPPLEEIERGLVSDKLKFLYATDRDPARVEAVLFRLLHAYYGVRSFQLGLSSP